MDHFTCSDGPFDGKTYEYPEPVPDLVVLVDDSLHYHEYYQYKRGAHVWRRVYHITPNGERVDDG